MKAEIAILSHILTPPKKLRRKSLRDILFIVRAGSDIIKADFMHIKRTTFPTKMKTGILLEELK